MVANDPAAQRYLEGLRQIWHLKQTSAIRKAYFPGAALHAPGGAVLYGHVDIDRFVISYLASFPDASLRIESATINREPESSVRVAVRWSLTASHSGFGHFGEPTGAPVYVMAMSHAYIMQDRVHMEWLLTDEVAIWKQIFAHVESRAGA